MPPKVKSLEAMAAQPMEEETQATQCVPDEQITQHLSQPEDQHAGSGAPLETPPKHAESKNGKSGSKKLRATMASLAAMEIANDLEINPYVVQRILDGLEAAALASLRELSHKLHDRTASHLEGAQSWRTTRVRTRRNAEGHPRKAHTENGPD